MVFNNSDIHLGLINLTIKLGDFAGIILIFILMLELKDKLLARNELAEGRAIQTRLLPDPSPKIPGWDAWLYSQPANDVGGDLIDCIRFNDNHHVLVLGDVSGKGLPAALLMVKLQATIRALGTETIHLADLGSQINRIFHRDGITHSFATLVVLDIHGDSGKIQLLNAGHTPPILIRGGQPHTTAKGNPALGLMSNTGYDVVEASLQKGDALMVYSDGINESRNEQGECFGNERLLNLIAGLPNILTADMGARILAAVRSFSGEARPDDDQTLLILKYLGQ
jgi:sigma-B regulation protein RsbU (phosphoserine phosphatase)